MKKLFLAVALVMMICSGVYAAECENITVADTAIGFTLATYTVPAGYGLVQAYCCNETAQIRISLDDDTSPTSATGIVVNAGDCFSVNNNYDVTYFKAIRTGSTSGSLTCCYSFSR
jgi:hypothetical protein